MDAMELIRRVQALPKTHRVVVFYECGKMRTHDTHSAASAESFALRERRKIGRDLIDRLTNKTVRVTAVDILDISE